MSWLFPCSFNFCSDRCYVMSVRNAKSFNQCSSIEKATFWYLLSVMAQAPVADSKASSKLQLYWASSQQRNAQHQDIHSPGIQKMLWIGDDLILVLWCNLYTGNFFHGCRKCQHFTTPVLLVNNAVTYNYILCSNGIHRLFGLIHLTYLSWREHHLLQDHIIWQDSVQTLPLLQSRVRRYHVQWLLRKDLPCLQTLQQHQSQQ